jgi:AraC-like DNA-binding protein
MRIPGPRRLHRELVAADQGGSFRSHDYRLPGFPFRWHYHPEAELTVILEGRGLRFVGDSVEPFREGDCVLVGPDCPHSWSAEPRRGHGVRAQVIQFDPAPLAGLLGLREFAAAATALERARRGLLVEGAARRRVAGLVAEICATPAAAPRRVTALAEALAGAGAGQGRELSSGIRPLDAAARRRLGEVLGWLEANATSAPTQGEAAARAGLSPAAFSRFFARTVGKTFVAYLGELKIGTACRLLGETDRSVLDIALASGFNNLANFNRRFRALKGVTPSGWRRRT